MKPTTVWKLALAIAAGAAAPVAFALERGTHEAKPVYLDKLPHGYREWKLISVAREEGELDDIRAILGNKLAIKAYREGKTSFPDGAIIARVAWSYVPSEENNKAFGRTQSYVAGEAKNGVQFMIKDAKRYAASGGWGYGHFDDGVAADETLMATCFPCHQAVQSRDFVFTQYTH